MRDLDSDWTLGNLKPLEFPRQVSRRFFRPAPLPLRTMAPTFAFRARSALGESIFIVGKPAAWTTLMSENENDFLRVQFAHVKSQPVAEEKSSRDYSPLNDLYYLLVKKERFLSKGRLHNCVFFLSLFFFVGI